MILARLAPVDSQRYKSLSKKMRVFDKFITWLSVELFALWTIFVAGIAAGKAQNDRYYFWDWSDWLIGLIGLITILIVHYLLTKTLKVDKINAIDLRKDTITSIYYLFILTLLFGSGWLTVNSFNVHDIINNLISVLLYFFGIIFIITIKFEDTLISVSDIRKKNIHSIAAIFLFLFCLYWGFLENGPVITTSAIISLPFFLVLLFGKHVRHLERAKFYPIFILAMFVSAREAWFIVPLLILFIVLRSYNYLRHQKIFPTFGVTHDQN